MSEERQGREGANGKNTDSNEVEMEDVSEEAEQPTDDAVQDKNSHETRAKVPYPISLPLARVKRIMKQDDEIVTISSGAVVAVAAATELFVQYFTEQALFMARGDKRKKLMYNDFANAVSRVEQLEFLTGLVPKTIPYKTVLERKQAAKEVTILPGQTTLGGQNGQLMTLPPENKQQRDQENPSEQQGMRQQDHEQQSGQQRYSQQPESQAPHSSRRHPSNSHTLLPVGEYEVLPQHLNPGIPPPPPPRHMVQHHPQMHPGMMPNSQGMTSQSMPIQMNQGHIMHHGMGGPMSGPANGSHGPPGPMGGAMGAPISGPMNGPMPMNSPMGGPMPISGPLTPIGGPLHLPQVPQPEYGHPMQPPMGEYRQM